MPLRQASFAPNAVGPPVPRLGFLLSPLQFLEPFRDWFSRPRSASLFDLNSHLLRDVGFARDQVDLLKAGTWSLD
jgi:hypothetical protein